MKTEITPEVIEALRTLRKTYLYPAEQAAWDILDNAGIFSAIDEATGYDVDPAPERVSKCTCQPQQIPTGDVVHSHWCPGDPAQWGDMAFRDAMAEQNKREDEIR